MSPSRGRTALRHLLDRQFRANPAFELVTPDRLPARYRPDVGEADLGLVLLPRAGRGISAKVLNGMAANLVRSLAVAGPLPADAVADAGATTNEAVARLVLDGALEIEGDGGFVSGPRAHGVVFAGRHRAPPSGRLAELSHRAIRYGQALPIDDVATLSRRLYTFGAVPRSPRWEALVGPEDDLTGLLGLAGGRARVPSEYAPAADPHWLSWSRGSGTDSPGLTHKLYLSPTPEALLAGFPAVVRTFEEHRVRSFKVGRGVLGLLRPDKVVAYLEDRDRVDRLAGALAAVLDGYPAHGVPFTAEATPDGLVSWGMDPPSHERLLGAPFQESWRLWVTNRLASALVHARHAGGDVEPWEFAVDRLALEGVDPATWLPTDTMWPVFAG